MLELTNNIIVCKLQHILSKGFLVLRYDSFFEIGLNLKHLAIPR